MDLFSILKFVHNLLRWVIVVLAIVALVRAYLGWLGKREWTTTDRKVGSFFTIFMDIQLLIGLVLYFFFSPFTLNFFSGAGEDAIYRFFGIEHIFYMVLAVVAAHVTSILSRRGKDDTQKHRRAAIGYTLVVLFLILGMPWQYSSLIPGG